MIWRKSEGNSADGSCRQGGGVPAAFLRQTAPWPSIENCAVQDDVAALTVVLRSLIEEFGGEAVVSTLHRRVAHLVKWQKGNSDLWCREVFGNLERCGAVTLEELTATDVIARIEPDGVILAYDATTLAVMM